MTDTIQTPADAATEAAVSAHISGDREKAAPLFDRASVEHARAAAAAENGTDRAWRDNSEVAPLAPMPAAPAIATGEVDVAIAKLNERGGDHAALVESWGSDMGENLAYAKSAFRDISTNRPDLIAKFEASGLGDDPAVLEHLASYGRLNAGLMGDHTIARRNTNVTSSPIASAKPRGASSAQEALNQLLADNPPGSDKYKSPAVQRRVEALSRQIAGGADVVGQGGRYA